MNQEEIIAFSEAYDFYNNMLSDEEKAKIPEKFVEDMKKNSQEEYMGKILTNDDICKEKISREGTKLIAFMALYYE